MQIKIITYLSLQMVSFVNLTQGRITCEESVYGELSKFNWHVDVCIGDGLN